MTMRSRPPLAPSRCSWPPPGRFAAAAPGDASVAPSTRRQAWRWRSAWAGSMWPICTSPWPRAQPSTRCGTPPAYVRSHFTALPHSQASHLCAPWWTVRWPRPTYGWPNRMPRGTCFRAYCRVNTRWSRLAWQRAYSDRPPTPPESSSWPGSVSARDSASPSGRSSGSTHMPSGALRCSVRPMPHGAHETQYRRCCARSWMSFLTPVPSRAPRRSAAVVSPCCPR